MFERDSRATGYPRCVFVLLTAGFLFLFSLQMAGVDQESVEILKSRLKLQTSTDAERGRISRGIFKVYENRTTRKGRMLELDVVILHARSKHPLPDPLSHLAGGPGVSAIIYERMYLNSWIRKERDIVLVSQRGTQKKNGLYCPQCADDNNLRSYLDLTFSPDRIRKCLEELRKKADLTRYSTFTAMEDINDLRRALGYKKINLYGTSGGTRSALIFMQKFPHAVRTAILNGVVPFANRLPLYHARAAQDAMDKLVHECNTNPENKKVYGGLGKKLFIILERLKKRPAMITVKHPGTRQPVKLKLTRDGFAEALRFYMYRINLLPLVPGLILQAYNENYTALLNRSLVVNRETMRILNIGLLLSVTSAEDVARIKEEEIEPHTRGTFYGDFRVRQQVAISKFWPLSRIDPRENRLHPSDVPTLLLSGTHDPVTPARWGDIITKLRPNSIHLTVPGGHGVRGRCVDRITRQFLNNGSVKNLDTSCVKAIPPIKIEVKVKGRGSPARYMIGDDNEG